MARGLVTVLEVTRLKVTRFEVTPFKVTGIFIAGGRNWPKITETTDERISFTRRLARLPLTLVLVSVAFATFFAPGARAAERDDVARFLTVTGFDVALESIRLSADAAPRMLGINEDAFGSEWQRLVGEIFDTQIMLRMGTDILAETLDEDALTHAADFYASDLGERLVKAENTAHMSQEDETEVEGGQAIIDGLRRIDSPRVALLERLNDASDVEDNSIRAMQEVQIRFLLAAAQAGVIELQLEEPDLRELMRGQQDEMRASIRENALINSAYTYQAFSDTEIEAYAKALEHPLMQEVYALMNAVQYEIMANRYEAVALRLSGMQPSQDL